MSQPTLVLLGSAEREVIPDRFVIGVAITSGRCDTPQRALAECADARARIRDDLSAALPDVTIHDATITTHEETKRVEITTPLPTTEPGPASGGTDQAPRQSGRQTEYRYETLGYRGYCTLTISADAARTAAVLAQAAMHPDAHQTRHTFEISRELARSTKHELEVAAIRDALARADGLAAAAGHEVTGLLSIGDIAPAYDRDDFDDGDAVYSSRSVLLKEAEQVEDALAELRPEPELRSATMPVRVTLAPISPRAGA